MPSVRRSLLAVAACVLLAGCGGSGDTAGEPDPSPTETTVQPTPPDASSTATPEPASGPVALAVADLAGALGVDVAEVEVVATEEVTWRNGSRGCAEPGTSYTQALVDGSRITLRVGKTSYEYHSGGSQPPSRCEKPTE